MNTDKKNLLEPGGCNALDLTKLLFAFIVVGMHQHALHGDAFLLTWGWMQRMAVPFFFVASAFLFFQRSPGPAELKHYVVRMLKLYGVWFAVMLPYTIYQRMDASQSVLWNVGHMLRLFLLDSTFSGSWFLSALLIAIPLVYYCERKWGMTVTVALAVASEALMQIYGWKFALPAPTVEALLAFDAAMPGVHNSWLAAMIYVVAGLAIARRWTSITRIPLRPLRWATLALMMAMAVWIVMMEKTLHIDSRTVLRVPVVILLFVCVARSNVKGVSLRRGAADAGDAGILGVSFRSMRKASIIIYISHFLFIFLLRQAQMYWWHHWLPDYVCYAVVLGASCTFAALLIYFQRRPFFSWLRYAW